MNMAAYFCVTVYGLRKRTSRLEEVSQEEMAEIKAKASDAGAGAGAGAAGATCK